MTGPLKGPKTLIAVGGPLHGHIVTVRPGTTRVLVATPDVISDDLERTPSIQLAVHRKAGVAIYEEGRDGSIYEMERVFGILALIDTDINHGDRQRLFAEALFAHSGLEKH